MQYYLEAIERSGALCWPLKAKSSFLWDDRLPNRDPIQKRVFIMSSQDIELPGLLASFLNREIVLQIAREQGAVQRERDFDPYLLLSILLLGFKQSTQRTLSSLCRLYAQEADKPLSDSAFRDRFNAGLEACFQALYLHLAQQVLALEGFTQGLLARFEEVLISDSTILTLNDTLAKLLPGVATPAAAKVDLMISARACSPAKVNICEGTRSDHALLEVRDWVRGKLLLFDLGYTSAALLARIQRYKGFFVARLKENANPTVVYDHLLKQKVDRTSFSDYLNAGYGKDFDLICEFSYEKRIWRGKRRTVTCRFRVVCLWNAGNASWMWYVTNLPVEEFSPQEIGVLYRARWLVEMVFNELKTGYGLDKFKVQNPHAIRVLIYAALMTLLVSRHLLLKLCRQWKLQYVSLKIWLHLFCEALTKLLGMLLDPDSWNAEKEKRLKSAWLKALRQARRKHTGLLEEVDRGIFYAK